METGLGAGLPFVNAYGPTEATITALLYKPQPEEDGTAYSLSVPIGRPISNVQAYVLDPLLNLVPIGVPGELHLGGAGVARGYWDRPLLTAERFIPDPFGPPGARLYKTGDLVRWRADGSVDFLGRVDRQVKIRGFRIEPGEIEAALIRHAAVRDAVVVACDGVRDTEQQLVAYLVPAGESRPGIGEIRRHLQATLPSYMAPAAVNWIPAAGHTGRQNRSSGASRSRVRPLRIQTASNPPLSPAQQMVAAVWADVLQLKPWMHDNFFAAGGNR